MTPRKKKVEPPEFHWPDATPLRWRGTPLHQWVVRVNDEFQPPHYTEPPYKMVSPLHCRWTSNGESQLYMLHEEFGGLCDRVGMGRRWVSLWHARDAVKPKVGESLRRWVKKHGGTFHA